MIVIAIIAGMSGPCGAVEIAVHGEEGAVLLPPLQVQHHPHLAPGEGGAGVLLAPALIQTLTLAGLLTPAPLVLLAVGLVPAPHHLETFQSQGHTLHAGVKGGGEGEHTEAVRHFYGGDD